MDSGIMLTALSIVILGLSSTVVGQTCSQGEISCGCSLNTDCLRCPLELGTTELSCDTCFKGGSESVTRDCKPGCYFCPECEWANGWNSASLTIQSLGMTIRTCNCAPSAFNNTGDGIFVPLGQMDFSDVQVNGQYCTRIISCVRDTMNPIGTRFYSTNVEIDCPLVTTPVNSIANPTRAPTTSPTTQTTPPMTTRTTTVRTTAPTTPPTEKQTIAPVTPVSGDRDPTSCHSHGNVFIPESGCEMFRSNNGASPVQPCPAGLRFSTKACVCTWPRDVKCGV